MTRVGIVAAVVVLLGAGATGAVIVVDKRGDDTAAAGTVQSTTTSTDPSSTTRPATTTTNAPAPTTTTLPTMPDPEFLLLPDVPSDGIGQGASSDVVLAFEQRLRALQFDPGLIDGSFDSSTRFAVEALEKVAGLPRDGRIGPAERLYLMAFKYPKPLAGPDREATRVELDLDRQVITVYSSHLVVLITTTSTGSGDYFCGGDDGCQYAITPAGKFAFTWRHPGWRTGKLGRLYNPVYFNGGIAVHGYSSVPTEPASHGCARIPMHIAEYFPSLVARGDPVYVVGTPAAPTGGGGTTPAATTVPTAPTTNTTAPTTSTTGGPITTLPPTTPPPTTSAPTTSAAPTSTTT
jgi:peptidoglycan hydrolase-like protein with peptidoglycan-binding domain